MLTRVGQTLIALVLFTGGTAWAEVTSPSAALRERQAMTQDVFRLSLMTSCIRTAARRGPLSLVRATEPNQPEGSLSCWRDTSGNCYFMADETDPNTGRRMPLDVVVRDGKVTLPPAMMVLYRSQVAARSAAALGACRSAVS